MKFTCPRKDFYEALAVVASVVPQRTAIPALTNLLVEALPAKPGGKNKGPACLRLAATDLEVSVTLNVPEVTVEQEGRLALPAARLLAIVREAGEGTVKIESDGHVAHVAVGEGEGRYKLVGLDAADFPNLPHRDPVGELEMDATDLKRMIRRTEFSVSNEAVMYALTGVLVELHEGKELRLVASDGKRLALARKKAAAHDEEEKPRPNASQDDERGGRAAKKGEKGHALSAIVPTKTMKLLDRLVGEREERVWVQAPGDENLVQFRTLRGLLTSRLIEGKFPDYDNVVPKDRDRKAVVETQALIGAIRRTVPMTTDSAHAVRFTFTNGKLTLFTRTADVGEAKTELAAEYKGEEFDITFNPDYVLDYLKVVEEASVELHFKDPATACVFKSGKDYTYVLMPLQIQM